MSEESMTSKKHNEYVGTDANVGRIPGAADATTGHHYVSIFPKEGPPKTGTQEKRAQEHLPPPTGKDLPPRGMKPTRPFEPGVHRPTSPPVVERQQPRPIDPAPGSNTVLDTDPFATPPSGGDTLTGATTQDLHGGIGQPVSGMSSKELHHDGKAHKKRTLQGKDQYGTADEIFGEQVEQRGEV